MAAISATATATASATTTATATATTRATTNSNNSNNGAAATTTEQEQQQQQQQQEELVAGELLGTLPQKPKKKQKANLASYCDDRSRCVGSKLAHNARCGVDLRRPTGGQ